MLPMVKRITKTGEEALDLLSYEFLEHRKIYICEEITNRLATEVIAQLEYLNKKGEGDIHIYINSPGGSVTAGLAIMDAMYRSKCDVSTVCTGIAASMGAFLLAAGTKGKRLITPFAEVMIHQPLGGAQGQATDIELLAKHIVQIKQRLNTVLAVNTGKSTEDITRDVDRDYYMTAEEAIEYGIVDSLMI